MNTLSWFLYLADVFTGLKSIGEVFSFLSAVGLIGAIIFYFVVKVKGNHHLNRYGERDIDFLAVFALLPTARRCIWIASCILGFILCLATFVPEKTTMYMILASEAGETVVTSPEAKESFRLLNEAIQTQLKQLGAQND